MSPAHVYRPDERPDVEVLVQGEWQPGELRAWSRKADEPRTFDVQYRPAGTTSRTIGTFTPGEIRKDTVDRSRGRALDDGGSSSEEPRR